MKRVPSRAVNGFTLVELLIGSAIGLVVAIAASSLSLGMDRSFTWGTRKVLAQQEASLLSSTVTRGVRAANRYTIYQLPDRVTPVNVGNAIALWDAGGQLLQRFEWSDSLRTVVDANGRPVTSMKVRDLLFKRLLALPPLVVFQFKVDDGRGSLVDIQSAAFVRNGVY
jgi:prepilin-type N-terminal cleavage/methylation domain-containing protein